jgi:hypothetical protein
MEFEPTEIHLHILLAVGRSGNGIDAIADKRLGLECVEYGWLEHVEHRRDDGQIIDVWTLTHHGRVILKNREREILGTLLIEAA